GIDKVLEINQEGNPGIHTTIQALTIRNGKNTIAANSGDDLGGGIAWYGSIVGGDIGSLALSNCTITNNVCFNNVGGGISADAGPNSDVISQTNFSMTNCTISNNKCAISPNNTSTPGGGGIALRGTVNNATIT